MSSAASGVLAHIESSMLRYAFYCRRSVIEDVMNMHKELVVGRYYWIIPVHDRETSLSGRRPAGMGARAEWQDEIQPARFNGWNANGEMLWNFLGTDDSWNWPVLWIGAPIDLPVMPTRESGKLNRNSYSHAN